MKCERCQKNEADEEAKKASFTEAENMLLERGWTPESLKAHRENFELDSMNLCFNCAKLHYYTFLLLDNSDLKQILHLVVLIQSTGGYMMYQKILKLFMEEEGKMIKDGLNYKAGLAALRIFRVVQSLGIQPQHVDEREAKMMHVYRKHTDMSIRDIAYVFGRSTSTVHQTLKKPVEIPSKEELVQILK